MSIANIIIMIFLGVKISLRKKQFLIVDGLYIGQQLFIDTKVWTFFFNYLG